MDALGMLEVFRQIDTEADLLFGSGEPSDNEMEIIFRFQTGFHGQNG